MSDEADAKDPSSEVGEPPSSRHAEEPASSDDDGDATTFVGPETRRTVLRSVVAETSFVGAPTFNGAVYFGHSARISIGKTDLTQLIKGDRFTPPARFTEITASLRNDGAVVICGAYGCGKGTAGAVALRNNGHHPVFTLPSDVLMSDLLTEIESTVAAHPHAGFLVESLDSNLLHALSTEQGRRLKGIVRSAHAGVVATVHSGSLQGLLDAIDIQTIALDCPSPEDVLRVHAAALRSSPGAIKLATDTIRLLSAPVAPRTVVEVLRTVTEVPDTDPERIAARLDGSRSDVTLREWLAAYPAADAIASLAASATLEGALCDDAEQQATRLAKLLDPPAESEDAPSKAFSLTSHNWPIGLVTRRLAPVSTHFGKQTVEVIYLEEPHTPQRVLTYLWNNHGSRFRTPFSAWLAELAGEHNLGWFAGYAAGLLFVSDSVVVERNLLRPWALSPNFYDRQCAALALGVPAAVGEEPTSARALAAQWSKASNPNMNETAILAYGGLLGAWDLASAAHTHLFRIGFDDATLRPIADRALAGLIVSGRDTRRVRGAVLSMLETYAGDRFAAPRVFGILPLVMARLVAGDLLARDSVLGLRDERESLEALGRLTALAFTTPIGFNIAGLCMTRLVRGVVRQKITEDFVLDFIRHMKVGTRPENLTRLGTQLKRALNLLTRSDDEDIAAAAKRIRLVFYAT